MKRKVFSAFTTHQEVDAQINTQQKMKSEFLKN